MTLVPIDEIREARERIAPVIVPTALEPSEQFSRLAGRTVLCKHEERQRTGSYKIRGAFNVVAQLDPGREVVAASAGNHAQGVARAARLTGRRATIFMPETAALPKVEATRADGADVRLTGQVVDESIAAARAYAEETGAFLVHPFDDPRVIAGQGTLGLELAEALGEPSVVAVPVGGGGLISGIATALAGTGATVVGVEAAGAAKMRASLDAGKPVVLDKISTIADGIAVKHVSELTLEHVRAYVHDVVTVEDEEISRALLLLLERAKAVVEPAGAVGLAAILAGKVPRAGPAVALLSGGNVDPLLLTRLIEHGLSAAGRYLMLRVTVDDRPGALAQVTAAVARLGLNIIEVEHHRVGLALGIDKVEVQLTLETRDPEHLDEALHALRDEGFDVEREH